MCSMNLWFLISLPLVPGSLPSLTGDPSKEVQFSLSLFFGGSNFMLVFKVRINYKTEGSQFCSEVQKANNFAVLVILPISGS